MNKKTKTKRIVSILLVAVMLLGMLPVGIIPAVAADSTYNGKTIKSIQQYTSGTTNVAWEINTTADLVKFGTTIGSSGCYGETFILTSDIDLNEGWIASSSAPSQTWNHAVQAGNWFGGTFDGQGHTISGLYVRLTGNNSGPDGVGMFAGFKTDNGRSPTVKNFALVNSYFEDVGNADSGKNKSDGVGAIVGDVRRDCIATIENVYSNAIVVKGGIGFNAGGLVGFVNSGDGNGSLTMNNCVFAGTVTAKGENAGGIVGNSNKNVTLTDCVNLGIITGKESVGGIIGRCDATTTITRCVNLGNLTSTANSDTTYNGNIMGYIGSASGSLTLSDCYYTKGFSTTLGTGSKITYSGETSEKTELSTLSTTLATDGSFSTWSQVGETSVSLPGYVVNNFNAEITDAVDNYIQTSWYNDTLTEYTISTAEELIGFGKLMYQGIKFLDVTIKLDDNINLNSGWTASSKAPTNIWKTGTFQGVFDGQGHSISGVYADASSTSDGRVGLFRNLEGATVQNLAILNSYFTGTAVQGVGSICGSATYNSSTTMATDYDKFINIYSEAIVYCGGNNVGGFVGLVGNKTNGADFENCVFAGTVTSTGKYVGGIVGNGNGFPVTITDCVNLGTITALDEVGGIIGRNDGTTELTRCVNLGTVSYSATVDDDNQGEYAGDILGAKKNGQPVLVDCYWTDRVIKVDENGFKGCVVGTVGRKDSNGNSYPSIEGIPTKLSLKNTATALKNRFGDTWTTVGAHAFPAYIVTKFGTALTAKVNALPTVTPVSIQSYTGNEPAGTVFTISTREDLLHASELSMSGVEFSGYTLMLGADINLNPGWDAKVTVTNGKATLPKIPETRFAGFDLFRGTFDGQNHTISGIFLVERLSDSNLAIFRRSFGATIINLKVTNSLVFGELKDGDTKDKKIGGLIANNQGSAAVIENCYLDMNVWYRGSSANEIGGVAARADTKVLFKNIVFKGVVGNMYVGKDDNGNYINKVPSTSTGYAMGGIIANNEAMANEFIACDTSGVTYYGTDGDNKKVAVGGDTTNAIQTNIDTATTMTAGSAAAGWSFGIFPNATTDTKTADYDAGSTSRTYYYSSITKANYDAYINALEDEGYTKNYENTVDGNTFTMLKNGVYSVYASYIKGDGTNYRGRVTVSSYDGNLPNFEAEAGGGVTEKLWQLNVDNWYGKQAGGMGYIIRLSNGKFIVIDGGYASEPDAKNIYKILSENNVLGGKPVVEAWFVTHAHDDHFGALDRFSKLYADKVVVEGFYGNFPAETLTPQSGDTLENANVYLTTLAASAFRTSSGAMTPFYKVHTGMNLAFADATALVLYTQEDGKQSYYKKGTFGISYTLTQNDFTDGNDTSTVIKFTVGGQTIMITGDASDAADKAIMSTWTASTLKSDIVQVSHHGFSGLSADFYEAVAADVALWPQDIVLYGSDGTIDKMNNQGVTDGDNSFYYLYIATSGNEANKYLRQNTSEVIPAF